VRTFTTLVSLYLVFIVLASCAIHPPSRDFTVELWGAFSNTDYSEGPEIARKNDEGQYMSIPTASPVFDNFICLTPEDYQKEREYQEKLKKSCKVWR